MQEQKKDKIVIIGAAILDILAVPADKSVFDSGSYPADTVKMSYGGDALNEAIILSSMGKKVRLETVLGSDIAGDMIKKRCGELGIELGECHIKQGMTTGINIVLVEENGERNFITNRNGGLRKLKIEDVSLPYPDETKILCFASIFVFPEIKTEQLTKLFSEAKKQQIIICADMTRRKNNETLEDIKEALAYVDYLMPNEEEAMLITEKENAEEAAEAFLEAGVKNIVIKCGGRGCYICNHKLKTYIPAVKDVKCIDTTGAGDSFAAGFIYGLSEGYSIEKCAEYANECGAKAVSSVGATEWL